MVTQYLIGLFILIGIILIFAILKYRDTVKRRSDDDAIELELTDVIEHNLTPGQWNEEVFIPALYRAKKRQMCVVVNLGNYGQWTRPLLTRELALEERWQAHVDVHFVHDYSSSLTMLAKSIHEGYCCSVYQQNL